MTRVPRPAEQFIRPGSLIGQAGGQAIRGALHADALHAGALQALYPFLYQGAPDLTEIIEHARMSALAKTDEIMKLRTRRRAAARP